MFEPLYRRLFELYLMLQLGNTPIELVNLAVQLGILHPYARCMIFAAIVPDLEVCIVSEDKLRQRKMEDVLDALLMPGALERRDICIYQIELLKSTLLHLVGYGCEALKRSGNLQVGNDADSCPADIGIVVELPSPLLLQCIPQGYERLIEIERIPVACSHCAVGIVDAKPMQIFVKQSNAARFRQGAAGKEKVCRPMERLERQIAFMDIGSSEQLVVNPVLE